MNFHSQMQSTKNDLLELGHMVKLPELEGTDSVRARNLDEKQDAISNHFAKIAWSEAILVLNHTKNGKQGYVGANTLMEIGIAFFLKKKIIFIHKVPAGLPYTEELTAMKPQIISDNLKNI